MEPHAPDPAVLRRRVLLAGALSLLLFGIVAYVVAAAGVSDWWLLVGMVIVYGLVIRPLMQPVRDASKLRRRLAFQAFLDSKKDGDDNP
ncbi:MAG: hypothetical protein JJD92_04780 [Frankiaceae bacterium]|nr:hypothetical protein [Frankiaceae bacterium]